MHTVQIHSVLLYYHRVICTVGAIDCASSSGHDVATCTFSTCCLLCGSWKTTSFESRHAACPIIANNYASVGGALEAYGSRRVCCLSVCLSVCMSFARISLQRLKTKRQKLHCTCNATIRSLYSVNFRINALLCSYRVICSSWRPYERSKVKWKPNCPQ